VSRPERNETLGGIWRSMFDVLNAVRAVWAV
jgi:hypothetical protein